VAQRVAAARQVQADRYNGHGPRTNAEADGELLDKVATPDEPGRKLLADAAAVRAALMTMDLIPIKRMSKRSSPSPRPPCAGRH
jgi:magnesium chelatase family protein